jgi:hypothetical protein
MNKKSILSMFLTLFILLNLAQVSYGDYICGDGLGPCGDIFGPLHCLEGYNEGCYEEGDKCCYDFIECWSFAVGSWYECHYEHMDTDKPSEGECCRVICDSDRGWLKLADSSRCSAELCTSDCICIECRFDADCPSCSNNVYPTCRDDSCYCDPCRYTSDCTDGWCCKYEIDLSTHDCVPEGTVWNYGGKSYVCDPPGWSSIESAEESNVISLNQILETIGSFLSSFFG